MGEFTQFSWIDLLCGRVIYNTHMELCISDFRHFIHGSGSSMKKLLLCRHFLKKMVVIEIALVYI
jgi:hypothetical protein